MASVLGIDALSWETLPAPFDLLDRDSDDSDLERLSDAVVPTGTRGLSLLSPADLRGRWRALLDRLRRYREDAVLLEREPLWVPLIELYLPPGGSARLRYERSSGSESGPALKILGTGYGASQAVTITGSLELSAQSSGKSLQSKLLGTVKRYVDSQGARPILRMDLITPDGGPEYRVVDLAPSVEPIAANATGEWSVLERTDLSGSRDTGSATWTYTQRRAANWNVEVGATVLNSLGITLLSVNSDRAEEFGVTYQLPYGKTYLLYCRPGESPVAPRCGLTA